jgi:hypothetical protein
VRLVVHTTTPGGTETIHASAVVVCTGNGTPVAIVADIGDNVAIRTARDKAFGHTLSLLGFEMAAPALEQEVIGRGAG